MSRFLKQTILLLLFHVLTTLGSGNENSVASEDCDTHLKKESKWTEDLNDENYVPDFNFKFRNAAQGILLTVPYGPVCPGKPLWTLSNDDSEHVGFNTFQLRPNVPFAVIGLRNAGGIINFVLCQPEHSFYVVLGTDETSKRCHWRLKNTEGTQNIWIENRETGRVMAALEPLSRLDSYNMGGFVVMDFKKNATTHMWKSELVQKPEKPARNSASSLA